MRDKIKEILAEAVRCTQALASDPPTHEQIVEIVNAIVTSLKNGGKVIVFGDGGSAADSQHVACELVGRFKKDRAALPAIALTTNTSTLTAIGNDYGFEDTFSRQLTALGKEGDVAICISTSGNSPNVLKAVEEARRLKVITIGLTGKDGGRLKQLCTHSLCVSASTTPRIQECHIIILHIIAELVEQTFYP